MEDTSIHLLTWFIGGAGVLLLFLFGLWWKVESKQDRQLESLRSSNGKEHKELHEKIDNNHHAIRDRLDTIWHHLRSKGD